MDEVPERVRSISAADQHPARVTPLDLFLGFGSAGLLGFGTAMPWARWMIVEKRKWLTEEEMINVLALCQFLPGPNVCNVAVCVGARFAGIPGALAAITGLMLAPIIIGSGWPPSTATLVISRPSRRLSAASRPQPRASSWPWASASFL